MAEETPKQPALSCPHLGILDDPDSSHAFPSTWNYCFYSKSPTVPSFEHQETVCLTAEHVSCPVYQAAKGSPFPENLLNTSKLPVKPQRSKRIYVYIGAVILLLALAAGLTGMLLNLPAKPSSNPAQGQITIKSTGTVQLTAKAQFTSTLIPTPSINSTPTSEIPAVILKTPALETSFKIGDKEFLIHRVKAGEGVDYLAKIHNTTPAILQATNYLLSLPIWEDSVILIRPETTRLDPTEPPFELYQITEQAITLEKLAQSLNIDLVELKYYNACTDRCIVTKGDWVLIPRHN